jgi:aspartate kinase
MFPPIFSMLIVQKYGGTSVGTVERINHVASRVLATQSRGNKVVVIVSAMSGQTDSLTALARAIGGDAIFEGLTRELDVLLASGEQVSCALLAMAIQAQGGQATSFLGHQIRIHTDSAFSRARIRHIDAGALDQALAKNQIPIVAGFQGIDDEGNITTLGRGGSDTSAVAVSAAIGADLCEIFTDVDGVYTADPRICPTARKIPRITFQEMMEMASLGSKVLQIRSVEIAQRFGVALHVRSSFSDEEGTIVTNDSPLEDIVVTGVSLDKSQARITVLGLPHRPGVQAELFLPLSTAGVVIDMIVQNPPAQGRSNLSFTVSSDDLQRTLSVIEVMTATLGATSVASDPNLAKISIVGVGMRSHSGVAQKMFALLAGEQIPILMISTSEIKVSCLIPRDQGELAVRLLHDGFGLA